MKQEDRIYKIRKLGNRYIPEKNTKYEVFGVTVPFPEFYNSYCSIRKKPGKIFISVLNEEELKARELKLKELKEKNKEKKKKERVKKAYRKLLDKKLITKEQFKQNLEEPKETEINEINAVGGI
uniref:Uncharacterized protein n=1 Tax=viral metagenome TaxID=1070528 RepID=A0A6H1ZP25_9ZZZZ